jgi:hypothetical protein
MNRPKKIKTGSVSGIVEVVAPVIIDLAKYWYTRMRHAEEEKKRQSVAPVTPASAPDVTKKGESS